MAVAGLSRRLPVSEAVEVVAQQRGRHRGVPDALSVLDVLVDEGLQRVCAVELDIELLDDVGFTFASGASSSRTWTGAAGSYLVNAIRRPLGAVRVPAVR